MAREELASTGPRQPEEMLDIGGRGRDRADRRRIQRASYRGEREYPKDPAANLEPARVDVLVRDPVADRVEDGAEDRGT